MKGGGFFPLEEVWDDVVELLDKFSDAFDCFVSHVGDAEGCSFDLTLAAVDEDVVLGAEGFDEAGDVDVLVIGKGCEAFWSEKPPDLFPCLLSISDDEEWSGLMNQLKTSLKDGETLIEFLSAIGARPEKGISGYVYQTVPAVLFLGIRNEWNFEKTISQVIQAGGDTDTTAAIAGALCGSFVGTDGIPREWINGVKDWPVGISHLPALARTLENGLKVRIRPRWSPLLILRNLMFLGIVLIHGFARLLPIFVLKAR